jgi:hypothetical protein
MQAGGIGTPLQIRGSGAAVFCVLVYTGTVVLNVLSNTSVIKATPKTIYNRGFITYRFLSTEALFARCFYNNQLHFENISSLQNGVNWIVIDL